MLLFHFIRSFWVHRMSEFFSLRPGKQFCDHWAEGPSRKYLHMPICCCFPVAELCLTLPSHGLQHTRLLYPPLSPGSLLRFTSIESMMSSNHLVFCCPFLLCFRSFPASGCFPMSPLFPLSGQSVGASASASVLPMNIQG